MHSLHPRSCRGYVKLLTWSCIFVKFSKLRCFSHSLVNPLFPTIVPPLGLLTLEWPLSIFCIQIRRRTEDTSSSGSLVAQLVKNLPAMQETGVRFLGWEDPLEKGLTPLFLSQTRLSNFRFFSL